MKNHNDTAVMAARELQCMAACAYSEVLFDMVRTDTPRRRESWEQAQIVSAALYRAARELLGVDAALASKQAPNQTPSSHWAAAGEPDPHGNRYDCERAALALGKLTDDELANGAFMNYDVRPPLQDIIDGKAYSPIAWMTAVKDRIRWLSRKLAATPAEPAQARVVPTLLGYLSEHTGPNGPFKWQFSKTFGEVYRDTALRIIPVYEPATADQAQQAVSDDIEKAVEALYFAAWNWGDLCGVDNVGFDEHGDSGVEMLRSEAEKAKDAVYALLAAQPAAPVVPPEKKEQ